MNDENGVQDRLNLIRGGARVPDADECDDCACYGSVRGNRRALGIELRRLQGSWPAPQYAWLHYAEWFPVPGEVAGQRVEPGSLVLHMQSGEKVIASGRNLRDVHDRILAHRIYYMAEAGTAKSLTASDGEPSIARIEWIVPA